MIGTVIVTGAIGVVCFITGALLGLDREEPWRQACIDMVKAMQPVNSYNLERERAVTLLASCAEDITLPQARLMAEQLAVFTGARAEATAIALRYARYQGDEDAAEFFSKAN